MKRLTLIAVLILTAIVSCTKSTDSNQSQNPSTNPVGCTGAKSYANDVAPIIQNVCAASGCHNAGSLNGVGPLTNYQQVFNARTQIRSAVSTGLMPQNSTLSADQKSAIICWIDAGASNN